MNRVLFTIIMMSLRILAGAAGTGHCGLSRDTERIDSVFVADTIPLADVTVVASVPVNAEKLEWFSSLDSTYCCDFMLGNGRLIQISERGVFPFKGYYPGRNPDGRPPVEVVDTLINNDKMLSAYRIVDNRKFSRLVYFKTYNVAVLYSNFELSEIEMVNDLCQHLELIPRNDSSIDEKRKQYLAVRQQIESGLPVARTFEYKNRRCFIFPKEYFWSMFNNVAQHSIELSDDDVIRCEDILDKDLKKALQERFKLLPECWQINLDKGVRQYSGYLTVDNKRMVRIDIYTPEGLKGPMQEPDAIRKNMVTMLYESVPFPPRASDGMKIFLNLDTGKIEDIQPQQ